MATTQEYAHLSEHVYDREIPVGENPIGRNNTINIGGEDYKILYNASNPLTGYQGMIYQKDPNGEIIVAHRGTEPEDPLDVKADLNMAFGRRNPQVNIKQGRIMAKENFQKITHQ